MDYQNISPELKAKAKACTSTEQLMALAETEGIELSDEQLEGVSGGWMSCSDQAKCTDNCGIPFSR